MVASIESVWVCTRWEPSAERGSEHSPHLNSETIFLDKHLKLNLAFCNVVSLGKQTTPNCRVHIPPYFANRKQTQWDP